MVFWLLPFSYLLTLIQTKPYMDYRNKTWFSDCCRFHISWHWSKQNHTWITEIRHGLLPFSYLLTLIQTKPYMDDRNKTWFSDCCHFPISRHWSKQNPTWMTEIRHGFLIAAVFLSLHTDPNKTIHGWQKEDTVFWLLPFSYLLTLIQTKPYMDYRNKTWFAAVFLSLDTDPNKTLHGWQK